MFAFNTLDIIIACTLKLRYSQLMSSNKSETRLELLGFKDKVGNPLECDQIFAFAIMRASIVSLIYNKFK